MEPLFSRLEVTDAAGASVAAGAVHTLADDGKALAVGVGRLPPGPYQVSWHVLSVDTHRTQGRFSFTVGR